MIEHVGKVQMNYQYYGGEDLYSDGDEIENHILDIVKNEKDYEWFHPEFGNWAILYHLSRQRENIVAPMDLSSSDEVLEIGSGMGAITGALAHRVKKVDCIELSKRRSLVNAYRHSDLDNIEIFVGNFQDIEINKKYDVITLIGVLEYGYHYINSETPYEDFLKKVYSCLKPSGKLYIAIENKLGMKYFAGYHEDHLGKPFVGIEGYRKEDKVKTFSKSQIEQLLKVAEFEKINFFYPFPDYKLPTVIYDDETILSNKIEFNEVTSYDMPVNVLFSQKKAFQSLQDAEEVKVFANSFLIEAIRG